MIYIVDKNKELIEMVAKVVKDCDFMEAHCGDIFEFAEEKGCRIATASNPGFDMAGGLDAEIADRFPGEVKELKEFVHTENLFPIISVDSNKKANKDIVLRAMAGVYAYHRKFDIAISCIGTGIGGLNQDEVIDICNQAHIFLLPSITASNGDKEGQALVLQEAQAVGLPVISTLHNGIPEGVIDGKSGFLVPEKDAGALAERIEYLIEHSELWPEMGRIGRKFVESKYDIKKLNEELINIYESLIEN